MVHLKLDELFQLLDQPVPAPVKAERRKQGGRKNESLCWWCMKVHWKSVLCEAPERPPAGAVVIDAGVDSWTGAPLRRVVECPAIWPGRQ